MGALTEIIYLEQASEVTQHRTGGEQDTDTGLLHSGSRLSSSPCQKNETTKSKRPTFILVALGGRIRRELIDLLSIMTGLTAIVERNNKKQAFGNEEMSAYIRLWLPFEEIPARFVVHSER